MNTKYGGYIRTYRNNKFFFNDFKNNVIDIKEIAHALALQCRWSGHCKEFYSIAEHSVYVSERVPAEFRLEALLHDASEAYVVDLSRPLKEFVPDYRKIQKSIEAEIAASFNVPFPMSPCVQEADDRVLVTEWHQLFDPTDIELGVKLEPYDDLIIECRTPKQAETMFLQAWNFLTYDYN